MYQSAFTSAVELSHVPKRLEVADGNRLLERVFRSESVPLNVAFGAEGWLPIESLVGLLLVGLHVSHMS